MVAVIESPFSYANDVENPLLSLLTKFMQSWAIKKIIAKQFDEKGLHAQFAKTSLYYLFTQKNKDFNRAMPIIIKK